MTVKSCGAHRALAAFVCLSCQAAPWPADLFQQHAAPLPPPHRQYDPLLSGFRFSGTKVLKSMIIYRIAKSWQDNLQVQEDGLQRQCSRSTARPTNAPLAEQWAMRFMTETNVLPASGSTAKSTRRPTAASLARKSSAISRMSLSWICCP